MLVSARNLPRPPASASQKSPRIQPQIITPSTMHEVTWSPRCMNYLLEPRLSLRDEDFFFFFLRPSFEERFAGDGDLLCFPRRPRPPLSSALFGGVSGLRRGAGNCVRAYALNNFAGEIFTWFFLPTLLISDEWGHQKLAWSTMPESKCSSEPIGVLGIVSIVGLNWIRFSCSDDDRVFFCRLQNHLEYWRRALCPNLWHVD